MALSISLLRTLIAISEKGSFSAAADTVSVSHAAVGQQMKRLEESLHVTLFDRSRNTPMLNQLGKALVPRARDVVHAYDTLLDDLTGEAQWFGELTLGAVPSTVRGLVPLSIKAIINSYPKLHIRVVPALSADLLGQVERGALDAAIVSQPTAVAANLSWQPIVDEELVLITSAAVVADDPLRLLQQLPYIRHTRQAAFGMLAESWLAGHNVAVNTSMEMESIESVTSMVAHDLGISIVPDLCVPDAIFANLKKIALPPPCSFRSLGVVTRTDSSKLLLIEKLVAQLRTTCETSQAAN